MSVLPLPPSAESAARAVPPRALSLSCLALLVPLCASLFAPEQASDSQILLWLLALVPAFLLAYYRGWKGAALALAVGMGVLALTQVGVVLAGRSMENWPLLLAVVTAYIAIALGVGWISELLHRERARAVRLALTDELTGLPNRRDARVFLQREFAAAQRGRPLTVILFDLDRFKQYNDRHGHAAGDQALRMFAGVLRQNTRQMNLSARYGGEEFLTVLSDTAADGALAFCERVRKAVRAAALPGGPITVSAGVAEYHAGRATVDDLLAAADRSLYSAKAAGRDRVCLDRSAILTGE